MQKLLDDWLKNYFLSFSPLFYQGVMLKNNLVYITLKTNPLHNKEAIQKQLQTDLLSHFNTIKGVHIIWTMAKNIAGVKKVYLTASGKGGVGKSTINLYLALAAKALNYKVGVLDLDIYGPSLPTITSYTEKPLLDSLQRLIPIEKFGIQMMSIGFMITDDQAIVWRGLMVQKTVQQLLHSVAWSDLDFLFIDLPPGTGDVQLTLAQQICVDGAFIITTGHALALADVKRAVAMLQQVNTPITGIIENMSYTECCNCHKNLPLFLHSKTEQYAQQQGINFLATIPFSPTINQDFTPSNIDTDINEIFINIVKNKILK